MSRCDAIEGDFTFGGRFLLFQLVRGRCGAGAVFDHCQQRFRPEQRAQAACRAEFEVVRSKSDEAVPGSAKPDIANHRIVGVPVKDLDDSWAPMCGMEMSISITS
jgi:hypothetical protein